MALPHGKLILSICLRILAGFFFLVAITMSKTAKLILLFTDDLRFAFSTKPSITHNIIWNNKDIKIDNNPIYYSNYIKAGILLINHLQFSKNNIES